MAASACHWRSLHCSQQAHTAIRVRASCQSRRSRSNYHLLIIPYFFSTVRLRVLLFECWIFCHFAVLGVAPADEDALRCKVVALIKADNIDDALSTIQSAQRVPIDFSFFKVGQIVLFFLLILPFLLELKCWFVGFWLLSCLL